MLTLDEVLLAESSDDYQIQRALQFRRSTASFSEQCSCDREIQVYFDRKGSPSYRFNCLVVHQPWKFQQVTQNKSNLERKSKDKQKIPPGIKLLDLQPSYNLA